jgi:hypothetical protein
MAPTALSFSTDHLHTDNAVMLMMAKHMLEKGEFPIFYYGQSWFGSLSAVAHAGVFLLLGGIPPWSIHVVPLLFFLGFCLMLYALTRDTLGPAVALLALAWNIVTPVTLSIYSTMPHGGYVEGLFLGTLLLWLSVRLVRTEDLRWKKAQYALFGFVGGLGWWTSPLVIYQLLASAAFVVLREGRSGVLRGALLSGPAFLLGAAPFFYSYATDPYSDIFSMGGGFSLRHIPAGLYLIFVERMPQYLDWELFGAAIPSAHWLAAVVYGAALLFFLWRLRRAFGGGRSLQDAAIFPLFFLVFTVVLAASPHVRRSATGYVMPLAAVLPVALGYWVVHSGRAWKPIAGAGYAAVFLLHGWTTASFVMNDAPRAESATQADEALARGLEAQGVRRVYLHSGPGSELLNFYARERVIASQMTAERYEPNFHALEQDPNPAFLYPRRERRLAPTLRALGASFSMEPLGAYDLVRDVRTRDRRYRQIPVRRLQGSASHEADGVRYALDRDMETSWTGVELKRPGMWVQFELESPVSVGMVRLWNNGEHHGGYAMDVRVETSVDGRVWTQVVPRSRMEHLYGSGPRIYPWEWSYRWEVRFAPVEARFVRVTQYENNPRFPWIVAEAYVYEDLGPRPSAAAGEQGVLARIDALGLRRVYADRWMSARIAELFGDRIETVTPFTIAITEFYDRLKSRVIDWSGQTGFVLEDSDADEFQRTMAEEGLHDLRREDIDRWALFYVPVGATSVGEGDPGWWWNGLGAVAANRQEKRRYLASMGRTP